MRDLSPLQKILYELFFLLRLTEFARFWNRSNTTILCYHGITEASGPDLEDRSRIVVNRARFLAHLRYLKQHYNVISLRDYLAARRNREPLPAHSVILTFDDGLRNFLTLAVPILIDLDLPATLFLVTERVESRGQSHMGLQWTPLDDRVSLSWQEVETLHFARQIEFGSHTCSHPELLQLASAEVDIELCNSFRAIQKHLPGNFPPSLAYPYGDCSELIARKARSAGYSCALTTAAGSNSVDTDLFRLRRAVVRRYDTIAIFAARVSGLVGWLRMARDFTVRTSAPLTRVWNSALPQ